MDTIDPDSLARWTNGTWRQGKPSRIVGLHNDSRKLESDQLFLALRTGQRDGHGFLESARAAGASGAIVERVCQKVDLPQLQVADVGEAILAAAASYRSTWQAPVVGITGSCGKTTCKEVLSSLLASRSCLSTPGNLNNLIGVPRSILRPEAAGAEAFVFEAGISEPGEMERLAAVIDPQIGIITAIGPAHLQDLGSVEGVAREKGKLLAGGSLEIAILGETCEPYLAEIACSSALLVRSDSSLEGLWAFDVTSASGRSKLRIRMESGIQEFEYKGSGAGLASNVALAIVAATHLGLGSAEIAAALKAWQPSSMRNEWKVFGQLRVFLDCYNANPVSMSDSLRTFQSESSPERARIYFIGCMEELGEQAVALHQKLGAEIKLRKQDLLLVIGGEASSVLRGMQTAGQSSENCIEIQDIAEGRQHLSGFSGDVFLKGSRRYRLESALEGLQVHNSLEKGAAC